MVAGFCADPRIVTMRSMYEYPAPQPSPPPPAGPSGLLARPRILIAAFAAVAALSAGLGIVLVQGGDQPPAETTGATTAEEQSVTTAPATEAGTDGAASTDEGAGEAESQNAADEEVPDGDDPLIEMSGTGAPDLVEPLSPAPVEPEPLVPAGVNPLDEACAAALAAGENLVVRPDPVSLPPAVMASTLEVHNCGDSTVDWTAATVPWVELDDEAGTLGGGATAILGYHIDTDDLGAFDFRIKVSEPGHNTYVGVDGFREAVGRDFQAGGGSFTAGAGAGGCNNDCIVSAQLTDNANSPDLGLRVKLDTPANVSVWVHTAAPSIDDDGDPFFSGVGLAAFTAGFETDWSTSLTGLDWATDYFIVVEAIDENGGISHRSGGFRTRSTGAGIDAGFTNEVDGGCSVQCIDFGQVVINPYTLNDVEIVNSAIVPADWTLWLSTQTPAVIDGVPTLGDEWIIATSSAPDQLFSHQVDDLAWSTTYHVVVAAEDDLGRRSYQSGFFTIADEPEVLITHQILQAVVINDGDSLGKGEISLSYGVLDGGNHSIGEFRLGDGQHIPFDTGEGIWQQFVHGDGFTPQFAVTMIERDQRGGFDFQMEDFLSAAHGSNTNFHWDGAVAEPVPLDAVDELPRCAEFGISGAWADQACVRLDSDGDHGAQFPGFTTLVGIHVDTTAPNDVLPPWQGADG